MEFLDYSVFGFFVVFIATLFIFGEVMVRVKGLFGIIGIVIMAIYFSYHLTAADSLWVVVLYLIGLSLIIFDGKVTTDGTIAAIGILFMVLGLALPAPGITYGVLVAMAFILAAPASYLFTKVFPKRNMWDKMLLKDKLSSEHGYNSMNETYQDLVGKTGLTKTPFRPIGTIEVDGKLYSATADNQWLKEDTKVKIISVDGTRIVVVPEQ
ncbi:NfeD family protein [Salipaludibacillus aurantiacus]|uniref:NfeD-like C-terminal, partner-binding n=1 Tax=Salipaludibacillus aurantiacus TaxID=1601833 RepID=A0A1H9R8V1_9BACI|nr:NfeD family protein [Salipaludibacillus aurantiacus]SER69174.1 NfeD-like C-terminal, partner-binding [Salipaludibacillus aurantiacus]